MRNRDRFYQAQYNIRVFSLVRVLSKYKDFNERNPAKNGFERASQHTTVLVRDSPNILLY